MPASPPTTSRLRFLGSTVGKVLALFAIIAVSGIGCGLAVGFPIDRLDLHVSKAVQIDHQLLGTFNLEDALAQPGDLPRNWRAGDQTLAGFTLFGASFCGEVVDLGDRVGSPLQRAFLGPENQGNQFLLSEVAQFRKVPDAYRYVRETTRALTSCTSFVRTVGENQTTVRVEDDLGDGPVVDYVARRLVAEDGQNQQIIVELQAGNSVIALQYVGPTKPPPGLIDEAIKGILARVDPAQFGKASRVPGEQALPTEPTTTTTTTTLPPTTLPPTTTTTIKRRPKPTTTKPPTTPAPATAPPATAAPATGAPGQ